MPLQLKPHQIQIRTVTQAVGSNSVLSTPAAGSYGPSIACLCVALEPKESFQRFGVVLTDAWSVLLEIGDTTSLVPEAEIQFRGQTFTVRGDVEVHQNGDEADCARFVMTRLQYPGGS